MKKIILENKLAFTAGLAIVVLLVAVSYADNLSKLGTISSGPLAALAQEINASYPTIITNKGIANSLASKLMDAQKALDAQNKDAAVAKLNDLISEVNAQKGKNIPSVESSKITGLAASAIDNILHPTPGCDTTKLDQRCLESFCGAAPNATCIAGVCNADIRPNCVLP